MAATHYADVDPAVHGDQDNATESLTSHRAATHWLMTHAVGARGVRIPDTALFDDEGVLEAWLSTHTAVALGTEVGEKSKTKTLKSRNGWLQDERKIRNDTKSANRHNDGVRRAGEVEIRRRDFMELGLLQFEAHVQDLAQSGLPTQSQSSTYTKTNTVAVLYTTPQSPSVRLDECALDETIRALCARERCMTSPEPDLTVSRAYPGGRFALQAAAVATTPKAPTLRRVDPAAGGTIVVVATPSTTKNGSLAVSFSCELQAPAAQQRDSEDQDKEKDDDEDAVPQQPRQRARAMYMPQIEAQCRALIVHLQSAHGLVVGPLALEFACLGRDNVVLTCAHSVQWSRQSGQQTSTAKINTKSATSRYSHHYRVCRQCRAPVEVDLARELLQNQTLLRGTVAKYQQMSQRHADAETRCHQTAAQIATQHARIHALETQVAQLRALLADQELTSQLEQQQRRNVKSQLVESQLETLEAKQETADALERIQQLLDQQAQQLTSVESEAAAQIQAVYVQQHADTLQIQQLELEMERLRALNCKWRTQCQAAQAAWDEIRFQWGFVVRKLTDVGDGGVLPPKRVAGGFSSYPLPTPQNVELVVKWIVDYETKRTLLDVQQQQQQHGTSGKAMTTTRRRLQMKMELMRLLAAARSPRKSPRRRRSSQSPRKRSSVSPKPKQRDVSLAVVVPQQPTLLHQQHLRLTTSP